jgi:hypothetical protein
MKDDGSEQMEIYEQNVSTIIKELSESFQKQKSREGGGD